MYIRFFGAEWVQVSQQHLQSLCATHWDWKLMQLEVQPAQKIISRLGGGRGGREGKNSHVQLFSTLPVIAHAAELHTIYMCSYTYTWTTNTTTCTNSCKRLAKYTIYTAWYSMPSSQFCAHQRSPTAVLAPQGSPAASTDKRLHEYYMYM